MNEINNQSEIKRERYLNLLSEVAYMYYEQDMIQSQIAKELCLSRSRISRLLQSARDEKIVSIKIKRYGARAYELEEILKRKFGLKQAIIVNENYMKEDDQLSLPSRYAAEFVEENLLHNGQTIGMSWGRSVSATVKELKENHKLKVNIVQAIGGAMGQSANVEQNEIILEMIRKYDAEGYMLSAPLYLSDALTRETLKQQPMISFTLLKAASSDLIITGIGNVTKETFSFMWSGYENDNELAELKANQAVGFLCGQAYDISGKPVATGFNEKIIGIRLNELKNIRNVVAIASGKSKAKAILGALNGRYIDTLVSDSACIHKLLSLK